VNRLLSDRVEEFKKGVLKAGWFIEKMFRNSISALVERNESLAKEVIADEEVVDQMEVEIQEKAMEILGLFSPIGKPLLTVTAGIRVAELIENIADKCHDIAKNVLELMEEPPLKPLEDIPNMANQTSEMLKFALRMFADVNVEKSFEVCRMDSKVDDLYEKVREELLLYMMESPKYVKRALLLLEIAGHIEIIADYATNIVEVSVYMVQGEPYKCYHDELLLFKKAGGVLFENID
jgi:phosphate transport system protein